MSKLTIFGVAAVAVTDAFVEVELSMVRVRPLAVLPTPTVSSIQPVIRHFYRTFHKMRSGNARSIDQDRKKDDAMRGSNEAGWGSDQ